MKKNIYLILLALSLVMVPKNNVFAKSSKKYGLGVMLGVPLGISGSKYLRKGRIIDGLLSFSSGKESFRIHTDYLFTNYEVMKIEGKFFHTYYGLGLKFVNGDKGAENELGVRIPGGVWTRMQSTPIEFVLEGAPVLNVIETTRLELDVGLIIRYLF